MSSGVELVLPYFKGGVYLGWGEMVLGITADVYSESVIVRFGLLIVWGWVEVSW